MTLANAIGMVRVRRARPASLARKCRRYRSRSPCRRSYRRLPPADSAAALPHFDALAATALNLRPADAFSLGRNSALERADCPIRGARPLHYHVECESEQRLAERWILQRNLAVDVQRKHVECACDLGSGRCTAGPTGHKAHFSDRGMGAEAAHAHLATVVRADKYSNAPLENEMHRLGALALSGDIFARLDIKTGAKFGQTVGVLRATERVRQPRVQ